MRRHRGHASHGVNPYVVDYGHAHAPIAALSSLGWTPGSTDTYPCATQKNGQWYRNNGPSGGLVAISVVQAASMALCASYSGPAPQVGATGGGLGPANTGTGTPAPSTPSGPGPSSPGGNSSTVYAPVRSSPFASRESAKTPTKPQLTSVTSGGTRTQPTYTQIAPRYERKVATTSGLRPLHPLYPTSPTPPATTTSPTRPTSGGSTRIPTAPNSPPLAPLVPTRSTGLPPATSQIGTAVPPPIVFAPAITTSSSSSPDVRVVATSTMPSARPATDPREISIMRGTKRTPWLAIGVFALAAVVLLKD